MDRIYITADLHIGHNKPFLYEPRGFTSIYDHDQALIKNWNEIITDEDDVYILGDVMLNDINYDVKIFNQLCGIKHIIKGNHDTSNKILRYHDLRGVVEVRDIITLEHNWYHFYMSHYPTITSSNDVIKPLDCRVINLCGHVHTKDAFRDMNIGLIYHCELDAHDMKPVLLDDIITDIKEYLHEDN